MPPRDNIFHKYINNNFVESGTYLGNSIDKALESGFKQIHSMEVGEILYLNAKKKYINNDNIHLYLGPSEDNIWGVIKDINEPITFWLDAHQDTDDSPRSKQVCPLLSELDVISKHPIKTHTILIDDIRGCGTATSKGEYWPTLDELKEKIYTINSEYVISFEDGHVNNDILVAKIN
jgi:hypothetical protein